MPHTLIATHYPLIDQIAEAWIASGASGVVLCANGKELARWGQIQRSCTEPLVARFGTRQRHAELHVSGLVGAVFQARLAADAQLVNQIFRLNSEVESLAGELVTINDQLLALYRLNERAGSSLKLSDAIQQIARETAHLLQAEAVVVAFNTEAAPVSYQADGNLGPSIPPQLWQQMRGSGRNRMLEAELLDHEGLHNLLFLPIAIRKALIVAGMVIINRSGSFRSPDLKLAQTIAEHIAAVIERDMLYQDHLNTTRMETEMELARAVQSRLLPQRPPAISGLDLFASAQAARHVGGDFFDFVNHPGHPFAFTIGDITGKGMPAALLMTMVRTMLHSHSLHQISPDPAALMARVNDDLSADFTEVEMFATVFIGQYRPAVGQIAFCNAGHAPVIYKPAGQAARLLPAEGVPMGVIDGFCYELQHVDFASGDLLIVATDGFSEACNTNDEMFGTDRLLELVDALATQRAHVIGTALFAAVAQYAQGMPQHDDQTLFVIKGSDA